MPFPSPPSRIAPEPQILLVQGSQPASPGGGIGREQSGATEPRPLPAGSDHAEGAFGIFGMMITGLIIIFAIVLLFRRLGGRNRLDG